MASVVLDCNGGSVNVLAAELELVRRGAWVALLESSGDSTFPAGASATLTIAGEVDGTARSFAGTVRRSGPWQQRTRTVIVGGAGKLRNPLPLRDHVGQASTGVTAALIAQGIAEASGETLAASVASALEGLTVPRWTRAGADALGFGGTAIDGLDALVAMVADLSADPRWTWRALPDGTIWIGVDTFPAYAGDPGNVWIDDDNDHTAATGDPLVYVIASGRANHAGDGDWYGLRGNSKLIGIEARNNGRGEVWSPAMSLTYLRTVAALQHRLGRHAGWVAGHKEYARPKGRKVDPAGIDMNAFRSGVQAILAKGPDPTNPPPRVEPVATPPVADAIGEDLRRALFYVKQITLGPGRENPRTAVAFLQAAITRLMGRPVAALDGDGVFGPFTAQSVRDFQAFLRLTVDGIVGPQTWAILYPPT